VFEFRSDAQVLGFRFQVLGFMFQVLGFRSVLDCASECRAALFLSFFLRETGKVPGSDFSFFSCADAWI